MIRVVYQVRFPICLERWPPLLDQLSHNEVERRFFGGGGRQSDVFHGLYETILNHFCQWLSRKDSNLD